MAIDRLLRGPALGALVLAVTGCGTGASSTSTGLATAVTVSSTSAVTGKWAGLLELKGGGDREDFVELTIDPDGTYRRGASRTVGLMDAKGKVAVAEGKIRLEGERGGRATGTLYESAPALGRSSTTSSSTTPIAARIMAARTPVLSFPALQWNTSG